MVRTISTRCVRPPERVRVVDQVEVAVPQRGTPRPACRRTCPGAAPATWPGTSACRRGWSARRSGSCRTPVDADQVAEVEFLGELPAVSPTCFWPSITCTSPVWSQICEEVDLAHQPPAGRSGRRRGRLGRARRRTRARQFANVGDRRGRRTARPTGRCRGRRCGRASRPGWRPGRSSADGSRRLFRGWGFEMRDRGATAIVTGPRVVSIPSESPPAAAGGPGKQDVFYLASRPQLDLAEDIPPPLPTGGECCPFVRLAFVPAVHGIAVELVVDRRRRRNRIRSRSTGRPAARRPSVRGNLDHVLPCRVAAEPVDPPVGELVRLRPQGCTKHCLSALLGRGGQLGRLVLAPPTRMMSPVPPSIIWHSMHCGQTLSGPGRVQQHAAVAGLSLRAARRSFRPI